MPEKLQKMVLKQQVHKKLRITEFQKSDRIASDARKQLAVLVEEHQAAFQHLQAKGPIFGITKIWSCWRMRLIPWKK